MSIIQTADFWNRKITR